MGFFGSLIKEAAKKGLEYVNESGGIKNVVSNAQDYFAEREAEKETETYRAAMREHIYEAGQGYENGISVYDNALQNPYFAIPNRYDYIIRRGKELWAAWTDDGTVCGMLNADCEEVIPFEYERLGSVSEEGLIVAQKDGKKGYINLKNEVVIPFMYDEYAQRFSQGLAAVSVETEQGEAFGYINTKNEMVIKPKFGYSYPFHENGLAFITKYDENELFEFRRTKWGVIDKKGFIIVPPAYQHVTMYENGIKAEGNGSDSYFDLKGRRIAEGDFEESAVVASSSIDAKPEGQSVLDYGEADSEVVLGNAAEMRFNWKIEPVDLPLPYHNSRRECGFYFRDENGEAVCYIKPQFEDAYETDPDGYAIVKQDGYWGVLKLCEMEE